MQIFSDKRHWWKVHRLLGSSIPIYTLSFSCATNSHIFSQMQRWKPRMLPITVGLPRKHFFFLRRSGGLPSSRAKVFEWRCPRSEWAGGKWWCKAKISIIKGKAGGVRWATGQTQLLIIVAVAALKQPCRTTCRTGASWWPEGHDSS